MTNDEIGNISFWYEIKQHTYFIDGKSDVGEVKKLNS